MEDLLFHLNNFVPQTPEALADLAPLLKPATYRQDETILRPGQINKHVSFIQRGMIMIYKDVDGIIKPTWFLREHDIFISIDSFFEQKPAEDTIVSLEPTTVVRITYEEHEWMCKKHHCFLQLRDAIKTKYYKISNQRNEDMINLTAAEHYEKLLRESPELIQRIPLMYLPGYLGTSKSTLDRIRKNHKYTRK
jgi:CRP-like cAMP-binding protein